MSIDNVIFFRDPVNYLPDRITEHGTTTDIQLKCLIIRLFHIFQPK